MAPTSLPLHHPLRGRSRWRYAPSATPPSLRDREDQQEQLPTRKHTAATHWFVASTTSDESCSSAHEYINAPLTTTQPPSS